MKYVAGLSKPKPTHADIMVELRYVAYKHARFLIVFFFIFKFCTLKTGTWVLNSHAEYKCPGSVKMSASHGVPLAFLLSLGFRNHISYP